MTILSDLPPPHDSGARRETGRSGALMAAGIGSAALLGALLYYRGTSRTKTRLVSGHEQEILAAPE